MKKTAFRHLLFTAVLASASLFVACGDSPEDTGTTPAAGESPPAAAPAEQPDPDLPEKTVTITGNDQMKFDVTEIEVQPRQKVTVTLENIGSMPKVSMGHNWVLLVKDADPNEFLEASMVAMGTEYIAIDQVDKVLANTKLLGPGESDSVTFTAPAELGDYVYLCSFPGHYAIGMKGILTVK
ncbi:MAG: azurin [Verrucomicrobiales bacterium]